MKNVLFGHVTEFLEPQEFYIEGATYRGSSTKDDVRDSLQKLREHLNQYNEPATSIILGTGKVVTVNGSPQALEVDLGNFFK